MKFLEIRAMYEILFSRKASRFVKTLEKGYKEKMRDIGKSEGKSILLSIQEDWRGNKCIWNTRGKVQNTV
jgi:mRNA-degrading endonuclease RelE of RelBE toxin-antitoxin system